MAKQNTVFKDAFNRMLDVIQEADSLPSEPELCSRLGVSRTTVRAVLGRLGETGLIAWDKREKTVLRRPVQEDYFPSEETSSLSDIIERSFMRRILAGGAQPGMQINELELARDIGIGTTSVREFLIRFSRFGLIEKRPNSHWVLKGFTREFALELTEVREMFELRSAASFVHLAADHPAWGDLKDVEAEHHALLADIDNRYTEFSELDERFHLLIQKASSNRFIIDFYDIIAIVFHYHYQWNKTNARARNQRALEEHLNYIHALFSRDPSAVEKACRQHLKSARETLLQSIQDPV
ncbi:GntR family transcriptional regulator [Peteryoungia desertarenae]|uniref:GntR family transcriptional regulator n=1 Tax=Peteryoungia desertarenae TaxID=1813451 RepID=A0ABX6QKE6_9HYPH|nr:GntR family transcriptional regulator [Peteryoungia desertarenae]QLF68737.1 GntR family transcriptional regulator [Peteryoungia desertarenae]